MKKKILIIHGWLHSAKRYEKLKNDIEKSTDYIVEFYECPGFGETRKKFTFNILDSYKDEIKQKLLSDKYEVLIGHSMGGNLVLKSLEHKEYNGDVILLSPAYYGINLLKVLTPLLLLSPLFLYFVKIKCKLTDVIIKIISLFTVNSFKKIDSLIIEDVRKADPIVATISLLELAWDSWRTKPLKNVKGKINIIIGEYDRVIQRKKIDLLYKDLEECEIHLIKNIGHTAVLEDYSSLFKILENIL